MIRACFFDLDGTLLDTEVLWVKAMRAWLADRGIAYTERQAMALVYGHAWRDIYRQLAAAHPAVAIGEARAGEETRAFFRQLRRQVDVRISGSIALLRRLAAEHPVAIVSGSPRADVAEGIAIMGIEPCVKFIVASEDYESGKPDPACFLMAARQLDVDPAFCLVFEDSAAGVRAAKAAGMRCVALARPTAPAQDVSAADLVLADLAQFDARQLP